MSTQDNRPQWSPRVFVGLVLCACVAVGLYTHREQISKTVRPNNTPYNEGYRLGLDMDRNCFLIIYGLKQKEGCFYDVPERPDQISISMTTVDGKKWKAIWEPCDGEPPESEDARK